MRAHSFQRIMLQLAFVAVLLMTLMPSLMRLSGHVHSELGGVSASAGMIDMPSMQMPHGMPSGADHSMTAHGHGDQGDCDYCPLLASLTLLAIVLLILPLQRAPEWISTRQALPPRVGIRYPCGLGSRGPPLLA